MTLEQFLSMFDFGYEVFFAFLGVLFLMAMPVLSRKLQGPVNFIMPFDVSNMTERGDDIAFIDIRKPSEFERFHAENAINVPADELLEKLESSRDALAEYASAPVALICQSDLASIKTAKKLERLGLTNVLVVKGGMSRWKRDNMPLVTPS